MKFKIIWLECHNPDNWADDNIEDMEAREKNGIQSMLDSLPNAEHTGTDNEGWVEIECADYFEADNIEEAKKKAEEYDVGSSGVFIVRDEKGNIVFDEGDLE